MDPRSIRYALFCLMWVASTSSARAQSYSWPQWRGPDRSGVSTETGLLHDWPADGPPLLWCFRKAGLGYSGPAIVGDRLYTMGARQGVEKLIAVHVPDGNEVWAVEMGPLFKNDWGNGPRGTPTVDGDRVYALSGLGDLVCAKVDDGTILWTRSMQSLGGSVPNWGYSESVLVDGDRLICTPGNGDGAIAALDKYTGDRLWQSQEFSDGAQYASMIPFEHEGVRQFVQLTMESLVGVDAETGRLLWHTNWPGRTAVVTTPVIFRGNIFTTSGYGAGCRLVQLGEHNAVKTVYANKTMKNHHGGVVLVGDHLFGYSDGAGWICIEAQTGNVAWRERRAFGKGSLVFADERLYCYSEQTGEVALIEASSECWREHGRLTISPQSELRNPRGGIWTHPVVCNGRLYLRDQELLLCYDIRKR